jgi:hypothetical protein
VILVTKRVEGAVQKRSRSLGSQAEIIIISGVVTRMPIQLNSYRLSHGPHAVPARTGRALAKAALIRRHYVRSHFAGTLCSRGPILVVLMITLIVNDGASDNRTLIVNDGASDNRTLIILAANDEKPHRCFTDHSFGIYISLQQLKVAEYCPKTYGPDVFENYVDLSLSLWRFRASEQQLTVADSVRPTLK